MKRSPLKWILFPLLTFWYLMASADDHSFVIVVHPSTPLSSIERTSLKQIFTARKQFWEHGGEINVVMRETQNPTHYAFCSEYLRMFPYQVERIWNQVTFSGQGNAATRVASDKEALDIIATKPGSITYVPADIQLNDNVKVLKIEEKQ